MKSNWTPTVLLTYRRSVNEIEQIALRAARAAGRIHLHWLNRTTTTRKSNALDLVTEADKEAEATIIETIHRAFPTHAVLAEESGASEQKSDHRWIVDPLDGTTNFAHGFPAFCVSIAYEHRGRVQLAVIFDALHKELFTARRGKGAKLNGKPIGVSKTKALTTSLLATGLAYDHRERRRFYLCFWEQMMTRVEGVRLAGSAALDLAYLACGRLDGLWEFGLKPWDIAAGSLLVEEAGGTVTNMDGSTLDIAGAQTLATNSRIHQEMAQLLREIRPEADRRHLEPLCNEGTAP